MKPAIRFALAGAAGLALLTMVLRGMKHRQLRQHSEQQLDEALAATFPLSDPKATQDFAIPANRI
jgi:hypothetical protein